jgi:hypothetical protein
MAVKHLIVPGFVGSTTIKYVVTRGFSIADVETRAVSHTAQREVSADLTLDASTFRQESRYWPKGKNKSKFKYSSKRKYGSKYKQ